MNAVTKISYSATYVDFTVTKILFVGIVRNVANMPKSLSVKIFHLSL